MLKKAILWILVIFISVQIFSFSNADSTSSAAISTKITGVIFRAVQGVFDVPQEQEAELFDFCHKAVRKTAHFTEYACLVVSVYLLLSCYSLKKIFSPLISLLYCLVYAITDEVHQLFVDGRSGQVADVCIDFLGAVAGVLIVLCVKYLILHRKQKN